MDDVCVGVRERSESASSKRSDVSASAKKRLESEYENAAASELMCMRAIGLRLRKFLFNETSKVSKSASEFILNCVGEYEKQLMRMLAKNERLQGRLDECVSRVGRNVAPQSVCGTAGVSFASIAARNVPKGVNGTNVESKDVSVNRKEKERNFAIVVKSKDESAILLSEQVKERVMRDVSKTGCEGESGA